MCGFVFGTATITELERAAGPIRQRGPDLAAFVRYRGFSFAHYLLRIATEFRPQPIVSRCGGIVCMFNGEIYNSEEFGYPNCDTDCLIPLYEAHGPEFARLLEGEFSIVVVDFRSNEVVCCTDTFATKPLWIGRKAGSIGVASYRSAIKNLGLSDLHKQEANRITVWSLTEAKLRRSLVVTTFSLEQHKSNFDDWMVSFREAVRVRSYSKNLFIGLSSGYDSGAIACALKELGADFSAFSVPGAENFDVLKQRHALHQGSVMLDSSDLAVAAAKAHLENHCEDFEYEIVRDNKISRNERMLSDRGALGLSLVARAASAAGKKACLSGQGADEIISDYGHAGHKHYRASNFGGVFPDRLEEIFPWPSFFSSAQKSYLGKEENVLGSYGLEGRYPFLDRRVVQEFLSLRVDLKNSRYKAPLAEYLDRMSYPYSAGEKVGLWTPLPY